MKSIKVVVMFCALCLVPLQNVEAEEVNQSICACNLLNNTQEENKCKCDTFESYQDVQEIILLSCEHNVGPR